MKTYKNEEAKLVKEVFPYQEGYTEEKFGFCIGDRVFWVGMNSSMVDKAQHDAEMWLCETIVNRWNAPYDCDME